MGMLFYLLSKIGSSIPRGFSRRYILQFIKQHPMITAKEIVDMAIEQSEGRWKPSPGYVYPMIWKLLADGFISEADNGRYSLTRQGMKLLSDINWAYNLLKKKEYFIPRIKNTGKSIADILETYYEKFKQEFFPLEEIKGFIRKPIETEDLIRFTNQVTR